MSCRPSSQTSIICCSHSTRSAARSHGQESRSSRSLASLGARSVGALFQCAVLHPVQLLCSHVVIGSVLVTITSPLHHHYITITSPLLHHYITITSPLYLCVVDPITSTWACAIRRFQSLCDGRPASRCLQPTLLGCRPAQFEVD